MPDKRVTVEIAPGEQIICHCPEKLAIHKADRCIVDTGHILESGLIVGLMDASASAGETDVMLIRCETLQDKGRVRENELMAAMAQEFCQQAITALQLVMRLVRVRYSFDRKLLYVVFAADERVDFRELVKRMAAAFQCRVELRQIGVRDEAGLIGGFGPCGRAQCCSAWLRRFESVNVRMARIQNLSSNPGAISGSCGRLKCCLRYEVEQYQEALHGLPREGQRVECPDGRGWVIEVKTLQRRSRVRLEDDRILEYDADELCVLPGGGRSDRGMPRNEGV